MPKIDYEVGEEIIEKLKTVVDPELMLDIWYLGLIYAVEFHKGEAYVEMTFTSPFCPAGPFLIREVKKKVGSVEQVKTVDVNIVFDPPWQPPEELEGMLDLF